MIARIWHGYTDLLQARAYEELLRDTILPRIEREHGCEVQLFVRRVEPQEEVEFITVCYFPTLDAVKAFAGEDYERCVVPLAARSLLKRFDERSQHYEVRYETP